MRDGVTLEAMADPAGRTAEWVERKGIGHPDTLCDALAEAVSRALSTAYLARCGSILHHNVDKVLLVGGQSAPRFGGGRLMAPIGIVLAGRATADVGGVRFDVAGIARAAAEACIRARFRFLDPVRDIAWECRIRPGSESLRALFAAPETGVACANDSSAGAGFAPFSPLERLVVACDHALTAPALRPHPGCGEDVKIAAHRTAARIELAIACAGVDACLADLAAYRAMTDAVAAMARRVARATLGRAPDVVHVNAADDLAAGRCHLTVTGSSAEAGDDGETGRGNRACGFIALGRPISLEATAGKNPVSHTGKLYNLAAQDLAEDLVAAVPGVAAAECLMASRIGAPIDQPALFHLRIAPAPGAALADLAPALRERAAAARAALPGLWRRIVAGEARLF